ncbi:uncharacterized protein [Diadema antillarum]|uniref:uncharacterized protein n=1 Tax=Diadema antillarum TaxID=105358 RepID=UPI003A8BC81E
MGCGGSKGAVPVARQDEIAPEISERATTSTRSVRENLGTPRKPAERTSDEIENRSGETKVKSSTTVDGGVKHGRRQTHSKDGGVSLREEQGKLDKLSGDSNNNVVKTEISENERPNNDVKAEIGDSKKHRPNNVVKAGTGDINKKVIKAEISETSKSAIPNAKPSERLQYTKTESPFDSSVQVGKDRSEPRPVFGLDAFSLSSGEGDLSIEDTFWSGKRSMIPDYNEMRRLDQRAIEAPSNLRNNLSNLVTFLTSQCHTDLEKFRVIFRWVAHNIKYNVNFLNTGDHGDNSPEGVLRTGKAVCAGYSNLTQAMCDEAGIQCETLTGYSKGSGYEPMMSDLSKVKHAWNRVTLIGQKFFCDSTWAAGSVDTVFTRHWKESHFLADPEYFNMSHIPVDLSGSPYTSIKQWNSEPMISANAVFAGLECLTHKQGIINAPDNEVLVKFRLKRAVYNSFCILTNNSGKKVTCRVQHWWNEDQLSCSVKLPRSGRYSFRLLGHVTPRQHKREKDTEVLYPDNANDVLENSLVSYVISASGSQATKPNSIHEHAHLFGAPLNLPKVGLVPVTPNKATIKAPKGAAHVIFQKIEGGPSNVRAELYNFQAKDKRLDSSVYCEQLDDWVVCHVRCPSQGKFALNLWVKGQDESISLPLRYTILTSDTVSPVTLPVIHGSGGPQGNFEQLGLRLAEALTSTILTSQGEGQLVVKSPISRNTRITVDLKDDTDTKSLREDGMVMVENQTGENELETVISLRFKKAGLYKLALFAQDAFIPDSLFVGHWLVVCHKPSSKELFPLKACHVGPQGDFFSFGLETSHQGRITCCNGEAVMEVSSSMEDRVEFISNLQTAKAEKTDGLVFADSFVKDQRKVTQFNLRMDKEGIFALRLFAKPDGYDTNKYVGVWPVFSDGPSPKSRFPGKFNSYGENARFRECGLLTDETKSKKVALTSGEGEFVFAHRKGTNTRVSSHLETDKGKYPKRKESVLIEASFSDDGNISQTRIRIRLKESGLFNLVVFASKEDGGSFDFVGVWLVECLEATKKPCFPETHGTMGPGKNFVQLGLTVLSPRSSTILADKHGVCTLVVRRNKPFGALFSDQGRECKVNVTESLNGKHQRTCTIQLPGRGVFCLNMFASEPGVKSMDHMGTWLLEWNDSP